ncbi:sugar kinase [Neoasaia chiangmaiensis NBRC 101099]|uniref:Carbohydrate kinase n=1 Tax=Neoasaia chiangmaiensis TaxID=320497 RepID=A0A1U9KS09_9PROT|nr:FGGY-family carbohydrate kinase [Neoasaia chiangmaiensis]AQS88499.1 carbohydrate kinase [Neoasaia chiangmaiensis]GBR36483.1 sugar kinase [Neoasaia chiangmaiensis NBRC 101099]GEN15326.1 carbohydrate kinase [Neoasaia chiangmaiensis]
MPDPWHAVALGIDIGTSGVRVAAIDRNGNPVGMAGRRFVDALAATDPATWWQLVGEAIAALRKTISLHDIASIGVDGTSGTMLAVDANGQPLGAPSMYRDVVHDPALHTRLDEIAPPESAARGASSPLGRAIVLARGADVATILHQADWIAGRLRGVFDATDANNALKTGGDPDRLCWPDWIERLGLDRRLLPRIHAPGAPLGFVGDDGVALGLPRTARVHAGTTDGCASFLATGADQPGDAVTALGSTLVVKLLSAVRVDAPQYGIYSHRIDDHYLVGGASNTGGEVLLGLFGADRLAALSAALHPDRPSGLDYYPLLHPGERFPISDPALPPRLEPRPTDDALFFQGVLEGIATIEAAGYARLGDLGATPLRSLRSVGGGATNHAWTAIRQQRLNVPFLPSRSADACVGVAGLALRQADRTIETRAHDPVAANGSTR